MDERTTFTIGESATLTRVVDDETIRRFADATGDHNPIHLDDDYASGTFFGGRIAHGALAASLISAVLGTELPGPGTIYRSQSLRFRAPIRPGDTVTARAEVTAFDAASGRVTLLTEVTNGRGEVLATGEAEVVMSSFLRGRRR